MGQLVTIFSFFELMSIIIVIYYNIKVDQTIRFYILGGNSEPLPSRTLCPRAAVELTGFNSGGKFKYLPL